ncbi:MAG: hypothetical protein WC462_04655 [archaeon]
MQSHKIIGLLLCLIAMASMVNASILASTSIDKKSLATNEIGILTIKLLNDSDTEVKNIIIRVQADNQIRFIIEGQEETLLAKVIESIPAGEGKEIQIKIKSVSSQKETANIYVYYGQENPLKYANVTMVETKELPVNINSSMQKKNLNQKDTLLISFKLTNNSIGALTKASAEILAPTGFESVAAPLYAESVAQNASIEKNFEIIAPLDTTGEQTIILAYGFFDANGPHYFEKQFKTSFQQPNYTLIIALGLIVLITAIYLYIKKDKGTNIKGTSWKK